MPLADAAGSAGFPRRLDDRECGVPTAPVQDRELLPVEIVVMAKERLDLAQQDRGRSLSSCVVSWIADASATAMTRSSFGFRR